MPVPGQIDQMNTQGGGMFGIDDAIIIAAVSAAAQAGSAALAPDAPKQAGGVPQSSGPAPMGVRKPQGGSEIAALLQMFNGMQQSGAGRMQPQAPQGAPMRPQPSAPQPGQQDPRMAALLSMMR